MELILLISPLISFKLINFFIYNDHGLYVRILKELFQSEKVASNRSF